MPPSVRFSLLSEAWQEISILPDRFRQHPVDQPWGAIISRTDRLGTRFPPVLWQAMPDSPAPLKLSAELKRLKSGGAAYEEFPRRAKPGWRGQTPLDRRDIATRPAPCVRAESERAMTTTGCPRPMVLRSGCTSSGPRAGGRAAVPPRCVPGSRSWSRPRPWR
jgi:hypothetical protein